MSLALLSTLALLVAQDAAAAEAEPYAPLDHAGLEAALDAIAGAHPELVTRETIGTSREGRSIPALRLAAPGLAPDTPAILLVANLEGPRLFETSVAVDHARRLADGWAAGDEGARRLLERTVLLVVPSANPDAAQARFARPLAERRAGGPGVDDDRDGRAGEDPPSDVDGDGLVLSMRVPDPDGEWMADPTEPRALVRAEAAKGQRGLWKLHPEGRDLDGDERVAEDAPHDARASRNFPSGWQEHTGPAGAFPGDEPEARALMDLVIARRSIALVLSYDELDDLVEKPKTVADGARPVQRIPPYGVLESDGALLAEIGKRYREAVEVEAKGAAGDEGTFQRWCYDHRGLLTLNAVLWRMPEEAEEAEEDEAEGGAAEEAEETEEDEGDAAAAEAEAEEDQEEEPAEEPASEEPPADEARERPAGARGGRGRRGEEEREDEPSQDAKRLAWIDSAGEAEAWRFRAWTPFEHPELGAVEIGGFAPYALLEPPADERAAIAAAQLAFLQDLGDLLPRVALVGLEAEALGAGVWRVEVALENEALLPLMTAQARRADTVRPARVELLLPQAGTLLSGRAVELVAELRGSGGRHELTWLVQGPEGMEVGVRVTTDHAGSDLESVEVQR